MLYSIRHLTRMIRVYIDRNPESRHLIGKHDPDTLDLDSVILSHIPEAARYVYAMAPMHILADAAVSLDADQIYWHHRIGDLYQGHLLLPDDFLRLYIFEMSDWQRSVQLAITPDSPHYDMACSPYVGICGTPTRPVCAVAQSSEGQILEFFSCHSDQAHIVQGKYMPCPKIEDDHIDLCRRALGYVVHYAGVRTLATIGDSQKASDLLQASPYTLS